MALKPDRQVIQYDLMYFASGTFSPGMVVFQAAPPGSGGMDEGAQKAYIPTNVAGGTGPSGLIPLGISLSEVVNIDQATAFLNPFKSQLQTGDKVAIGVKGDFRTNMLYGAAVATGATYPVVAYAAISGLLTDQSGYAGSGWPVVGKFLSRRDADGYARVRIDL